MPILTIAVNSGSLATELTIMLISTELYWTTDIGGDHRLFVKPRELHGDDLVGAFRRTIRNMRKGLSAVVEVIGCQEPATSVPE